MLFKTSSEKLFLLSIITTLAVKSVHSKPYEKFGYKGNIELENLESRTGWDKTCVKGSTYNYLSLISQNYFDKEAYGVNYDQNYYFPSSAGKDANIFFVDSGCNFHHKEFANDDDRTVECLAYVDHNGNVHTKDSEYNQKENPKYCVHASSDYHGLAVMDIAGGIYNGVAPRANLYGISMELQDHYEATENYIRLAGKTINFSTYYQSLKYIYKNYLDEKTAENAEKYQHKTIINLSNSFRRLNGENLEKLSQLIDDITAKGAIIVASAGNDGSLSDSVYYPCSFSNVICVGAIDNIGMNKLDFALSEFDEKKTPAKLIISYEDTAHALMGYKDMETRNYSRAYYSNFGKEVNIYAPGFVRVEYNTGINETTYEEHFVSGTSFSAPIVSGVIATIMSEKPHIKHTKKDIFRTLSYKGLKNIIKGIDINHPNLFVNNGKDLTYEGYGKYNRCGNPHYFNEKSFCTADSGLDCFEYGCCIRDKK